MSYQIIGLSMINQNLQRSSAEINDVKYGLFSINQWKLKLSQIVNDEILKFEVTGNDKQQLKPLVEKQLDKLIDNVYEKMVVSNGKSFKGKVKQVFLDTLVDIDDIKAGIPGYADDVIKIMERPKTKAEIKGLLVEKVETYFEKTFEKQDLTRIDEIVAEMGTTDLQSAKEALDKKVQEFTKAIYLRAWLIIALSIFIFILACFSRKQLGFSGYMVMVTTLIALLVTGVTTPMINLEAKITEMSFVLFDQPVSFLNQVLYFQSKSVLDVFWIMISHEQLQMKFVGLLMITFSIVFPLVKLLSSVAYYRDVKNIRQNVVFRFFVLKSGKWSMSDVLVIAIFMAYIGFNGIISSQFGSLHSSEQIVLLTTNGTSLQPGFYLFFTYTILALFLTGFLVHDDA